MSQSKTETFAVAGMSCAACASSVERILHTVDGVQEANVNLASNTLQLTYPEATAASTLHHALQDVGYD